MKGYISSLRKKSIFCFVLFCFCISVVVPVYGGSFMIFEHFDFIINAVYRYTNAPDDVLRNSVLHSRLLSRKKMEKI